MAVPTIISMLVTSIYNIVDTYYVGLINTQATAAVGVAFPVMSIIQAVGFFFGQGSGTYMSRQLGAQQVKHASSMASVSFFSAIAVGIILAIAGLVFLTPLSIAFGSTSTILPYTEQYLGAVVLGAPVMMGTMVLNNQMRFQGNAMGAMYGMMTGAALNVILVPIFTFSLGMGILGTGIGTVLSQLFAFAVLFAMSRRKGNIAPLLKHFSWDITYFKEIVMGGTPSLTRQGLASISTMMLNIAAAVYGDAAIAGMSIVTRIAFVVFAVIIGIGQGFQPLCGFCYGAGLFQRVKQGYFYSIKLSIVFLLFSGLGGFLWAEQLIDILRHDPDVVAVGAIALRWQIATWPFAAVVTVSNMCLQTSGRTISANILAACRNGICFIPLILILPYRYGLWGVEITQAVADILTFIIALPLMTHYFRRLRVR